MQNKCLVVLSGGQDSTTALFWAKQKFEEVHAITFDYGQRHDIEVDAALMIAGLAGCASHEIVFIGHDTLQSRSPLTNPDEELETYSTFKEMDQTIGSRIEKTFVPMRNALFLVIAANRAVCLGTKHLVTGVCEADNANYPDCRASFVTQMERMIEQALGLFTFSFEIHAPLIALSKARGIKLAQTLPGCMEALAYSHTAYDGKYPPTGKDHASVLRAHGFEQAGVPDPLVVRAWREGLMELPATANYEGLK